MKKSRYGEQPTMNKTNFKKILEKIMKDFTLQEKNFHVTLREPSLKVPQIISCSNTAFELSNFKSFVFKLNISLKVNSPRSILTERAPATYDSSVQKQKAMRSFTLLLLELFDKTNYHSLTPLFCWDVGGGGGAEPPIKFLKRGAWQDLNFQIGYWEREG